MITAEDYDDWDEGEEYDPDPDDYYNDDREPDEPDWDYLEWLAELEDHFDRKHGGNGVCNCKPSLWSRVADRLQRRIAALRWRSNRWRRGYTDKPPF